MERHSEAHRITSTDRRSRVSLWRDVVKMTMTSMDEDEKRLIEIGYRQEVKRIFTEFTNFGLAAGMISVVLGIIPLYTFELSTGGPVVMFWSWVVVGTFTIGLVMSLGEICCAYPTMGALYFWAYKLGGDTWGPYASWIAGWCNLLGQIAGVASGAFAGAEILSELIILCGGTSYSEYVLMYYALILAVAGIVNTYAELMLTAICYVSFYWQVVGVLVIVISMLATAPTLQSANFVFFEYHEDVGFPHQVLYVALVGSLAAASAFTGYDTAAHVAEETKISHISTPNAMLYAVLNAFILGLVLIMGMNFCIPGDVGSFLDSVRDDDTGSQQAYTLLWRQTVGKTGAIVFLLITLVAIECSNCANLTSAARMVYAFSRDNALPGSKFFYHIDPKFGGPVRAIWLSLFIALLLAVPSLWSNVVLEALFSLTATGLYASYIIPILLRVTVARDSFVQKEFSLGRWSVPIGCISVVWALFMVVILCLPQSFPTDTVVNLNYAGVTLGAVLLYAILSWHLSAKNWYKVSLYRDELAISSDSSQENRLQRQKQQLQQEAEWRENQLRQQQIQQQFNPIVNAANASASATAMPHAGAVSSPMRASEASISSGPIRASFEVYSIS